MGDIKILAIESSCDETAAAVVKNGREVLSNIISSQIDIHKKYGGVVPEIASRCHIAAVDAVVDEALTGADVTLDDIDAIAVTYGPGLVGALLVGVSCAKALAFAKIERSRHSQQPDTKCQMQGISAKARLLSVDAPLCE